MQEDDNRQENQPETEQKQDIKEEDIVVANMNVEGMPWYREEKQQKEKHPRPGDQLSRKEMFYVIMGAMKAALLIALVISAVWILVTLFCTQIWFR